MSFCMHTKNTTCENCDPTKAFPHLARQEWPRLTGLPSDAAEQIRKQRDAHQTVLKKVFAHGVEEAARLLPEGVVMIAGLKYRWVDPSWVVVLDG